MQVKSGDTVRSTIRGWYGHVMEVKDHYALVCWDGIRTENWIDTQYIVQADRRNAAGG